MGSVRAYPPPQPHRIMTSTMRAHTEPAPSGFIQSVMSPHAVDDFDEGIIMSNQPKKKITQEEQDAEDDKALKRAMRNLVNSWQERLQLISVITTFFASTEAAMLVNTKPANDAERTNRVLHAANACLLGALIAHVYAAVLSFLGAFFLIRFKLKEATREEMIAEGIRWVNSPLSGSEVKDVEQHAIELLQQRTLTGIDGQPTMHRPVNHNAAASAPEQNNRNGSYPVEPPIFSRNPHVEQVGPFASAISSHLLSRTHTICVLLAALGFILAIAGILCYSWALQSQAVSIFASASLGFAVLAMVVLFI